MTIEDIRNLFEQSQKRKPGLFRHLRPDDRATEDQLRIVEHRIGYSLPQIYRDFLCHFGGGEFALLTLFSADPKSEWYLPRQNEQARVYLPANVIAFSDDFAGGNYVFKAHNSELGGRVFYWNSDGGLVSTPFHDALDFIARYAFE